MSATDAVRRAFGATAGDYDAARRQLIPGFEDFYDTAVAALPFAADAAPTIADLGAGTGILSARIADAFPNARLILIDLADEMLAIARQRLSGRSAVAFRTGDYAAAALPEDCDAVVSALSIHHLADAAKRRLFQRVFTALKPGGVFVNAEQVVGPTPALERFYDARWLAQVRAAGVTPEALAAARERMREDRPATLAAQMGWLAEAGFIEVDCFYKNGRFAVYAGRKPAV